MEMVISATLAARGYAVVTEADPEGERFNKIYARPPIFDPGIALELGTVIEDNYDRMRNLHPDAKCNMPTILLPGSVS